MPNLSVALLFIPIVALGQLGTLKGVVRDPAGAALPSAKVELRNPGTGFFVGAETNLEGTFILPSIPLNTYSVRVSASGFEARSIPVAVFSAVPIDLDLRMELAQQQTSINVDTTTGSLVDTRPISSGTVARDTLEALPALSPDSGLNDAIIMTTAGVAADSNGFFHPLGDHAQVSYVLDGQPISDQRNKVFSTSIPANAIQSMEVIAGSPPAEYGDKTSLVINAATRSGLGQKPSGSLQAGYGSFGTVSEESTLGLGSTRWGNFVAANAERTGRFLDTPEFWPMHDVGNTWTVFDRLDLQHGASDSFHLNAMASRNWFQVPNTYDQARQDQRQKVVSFNIAPGFQRSVNGRTLLSMNGFVRHDQVDYYPSRNPFDDAPATVGQSRSLTNWGGRMDLSRLDGRHNWKIGGTLTETRLDEEFRLGVTDAAYGFAPYNLALGGRLYEFRGGARIHQASVFGQDAITVRRLVLSIGLRYDRYDGITKGDGVQPRLAFSYLIRATGTVLRGGYSHTMETPTNENLVVSSSTGTGGLAGNLFQGSAEQRPIGLGRRNQYDAGVAQSLGRWVTLDVSYFRKYTRNAYDFDALLGTPVTFPIGWRQSKLDGISARISTTDIHGLRAYVTMGHANARFFGPEVGGVILNSNLATGAYRQDHDQVYQQNANLRYQHHRSGWWADFGWRHDSGLVVGAVNGLQDALDLTADQQAAIGFYCGAERSSLVHRITACATDDYGAERIHILAPGTENDDRNPPRAKGRNVFSLGVGSDNLLRGEKHRLLVRFTIVNLSNQAALYNFLSPFSGTHWVGPRTYEARVGWAF